MDRPDPATLSDEELDAILNPPEEEVEEVETPVETPSEEPETEEKEVVEDAPKEQPEEPADEKVVEEPQPSRREQLRINKLLEKYGNPDVPNQPTPAKRPEGVLNYEEDLETDPETAKRLNDDREAYGRQLYQEGLEQAKSLRFQTRLELDAPKVEAKFPFLDKTSDEFNPQVAQALNLKYLEHVGYDPKTGSVRDANTRYAEFVEAEVELAQEIAQRQVKEATTRVVKQAAQTAVRPSGTTAKRLNLNKAPQDMSDEELNAYLKKVIG